MQQLSGQDASFLYFETPKAPMHIGSFFVYNPQDETRCRVLNPEAQGVGCCAENPLQRQDHRAPRE
ncbi:MAG: hypothetical protein FJ194_17080 [Gammaproteobacteria bacterium]|nr:hypothetical protein [Gammaproteobacteria bacterium]